MGLFNRFSIPLLLVLSFYGPSINADESQSFRLERLVGQLCEHARTDNLVGFRALLRRKPVHVSVLYSKVKCEGKSLLQLALYHHSDAVEKYLRLRVERKELGAIEPKLE